METNGRVFLYNATSSNLKVKLNDPTLNENGTHFVAGATKETHSAPRLGAEAVDRGDPLQPNQFGYGDNKVHIFRDAPEGGQLADFAKLSTENKKKLIREVIVKINPDSSQIGEDLMLHLFLVRGIFGFVLVDQEGETKDWGMPIVRSSGSSTPGVGRDPRQ